MVEVLSKKPKKKWISGNGYAYIYVDGKAVLEHRHVVEKALNVRLSSDQAVHHKNHIRTDNRIENLEVCDRGEHARVHIMEVKPWGK